MPRRTAAPSAEVRCGLASRGLDRTPPRSSSGRWRGPALVAAAVALMAVAAVTAMPAEAPAPQAGVAPVPPPIAVIGALPAVPAPVPVARTAQIDAEAPPPRGLVIERLGIDTELVDLRVGVDGALQVPEDFDLAGWHRDGTVPGDTGPAVLVGHVDSYEGPAVFARLGELRPDDLVLVTRTDGKVVEFVVYGAETVPKDAFPTDRVYADTPGPELRLLTCGGSFDEQARSYRDNVVVYARLAAPPAAS